MYRVLYYNFYFLKSFLAILVLPISVSSFSQISSTIDTTNKKKSTNTGCIFLVDSSHNKYYTELGPPHHLRIPIQSPQDADGDGILDQLDLEPNTPRGADVDTHGRAIDTDGDGVPDFKDKEKLTQQICFPVDSNGVGACPELGCCREFRRIARRMWANSGSADSILYSRPLFPSQKYETISLILSKAETALLDSAVNRILANRNRDIHIKYHASADYSIREKQKEKIELLKKYILDKTGISEIVITIDNHIELISSDNVVQIISSPWMAFD